MKDQAEVLRRRIQEMEGEKQAKTIAIASGKGGVGKSNFCINFALQLMRNDKKVLIFDLDIGMGNIDILMGKSPRRTFVDLFREEMSIRDIIELGPESLSYIAGGSGLSHIFELDQTKFAYFQSEFEELTKSFDYILFDMGAGATQDSLHFISSAHEAIVVTTPEPTSLTDGYAMIKHLVHKDKSLPIKILVNRSLNEKNGRNTFDRLSLVVERFLEAEVALLGVLPDDRSVLEAVNKQQPFVIDRPKSKVSRSLEELVRDYLNESHSHESPLSFVDKLKRFVFER
ncbi:MinD/ParA family protein [Halobacillus aidingensis]|uniref:Flagellar biosynthesis protein FlhG n=1 Tax=Halobacillus aidingensis TaxID=240303 RepID=A0A1H0MTA6_HALAD|nr:MinD/ParA family protein [Halobacillus aidingensis]SDO83688.1 flagellar biosynthesis protein FlhG [Halobacillus aidingensis]